MLQVIIIGAVGADAKLQEKDGRKFTTFRVAHNDTWTDEAGQQHTSVTWVDCTMNDHPKVAEFIKTGSQVAVIGNASLRIYSSERERRMLPGLRVQVRNVELIGGKPDAVPSRLYDKDGVQHDVTKFYLTDKGAKQLQSSRGELYNVDEHGWVSRAMEANSNQPNDGTQS